VDLEIRKGGGLGSKTTPKACYLVTFRKNKGKNKRKGRKKKKVVSEVSEGNGGNFSILQRNNIGSGARRKSRGPKGGRGVANPSPKKKKSSHVLGRT